MDNYYGINNGFKMGMNPVTEVDDDNNYVEHINIKSDIEEYVENPAIEILEMWFKGFKMGSLKERELTGYLHGAYMFTDSTEVRAELNFLSDFVEAYSYENS